MRMEPTRRSGCLERHSPGGRALLCAHCTYASTSGHFDSIFGPNFAHEDWGDTPQRNIESALSAFLNTRTLALRLLAVPRADEADRRSHQNTPLPAHYMPWLGVCRAFPAITTDKPLLTGPSFLETSLFFTQ